MQTLDNLYKSVLTNEDYKKLEVNYIQRILSSYGKGILNITKMLDGLTKERVKHIISMFLMGKLLYESVGIIKEAMNKFINSYQLFPDTQIGNTQEKFDFIWMLTAFYHDVGYILENNEVVCMQKIKSLTSYNYPMEYGKQFIPECYDKDLLNSYAWYRFIVSKKCDHGVVGAQNFYNELISANYGKRIPTYNVYEVVCLCIACHNVWFPNDDTISTYKVFGLKKLADAYENATDKKIRVINLQEHPLLFLLSLADNIEPSKKSCSLDWMNNVCFDFSETNKNITIKNVSNDKKYLNSVLQLNSWLVDVKQNSNDENSIVLQLN